MTNKVKIDEGLNLIKKAEKCLKTSLLNWTPDVDSAINHYTDAVECFKAGGDLNKAIEILMKLADLHDKNKSQFYSAKALEDAAQLYYNLKNTKKFTELILNAGNIYRANGTSNAACQLMVRVSKNIEGEHPEIAAKFYQVASDAAQDGDSLKLAGDYIGQTAKMLIRSKSESQMIVDCLISQMNLLGNAGNDHEASKALIAAVLVKLHFDNDVVGATKLFEKHCGNAGDSNPIQQLLDAYHDNNAERIQSILKSGTFIYLENDYAKLARDLANKQKSCEKQASPQKKSMEDTNTGASNQIVDDDEEDVN